MKLKSIISTANLGPTGFYLQIENPNEKVSVYPKLDCVAFACEALSEETFLRRPRVLLTKFDVTFTPACCYAILGDYIQMNNFITIEVKEYVQIPTEAVPKYYTSSIGFTNHTQMISFVPDLQCYESLAVTLYSSFQIFCSKLVIITICPNAVICLSNIRQKFSESIWLLTT